MILHCASRMDFRTALAGGGVFVAIRDHKDIQLDSYIAKTTVVVVCSTFNSYRTLNFIIFSLLSATEL